MQTFKAFAGINNRLPPERIHSLPTQTDPTCELVTATNIDIDDSGRAARRAGQTLKVAGASHSLWCDAICLCVQAGALKQINTDYSTTTLATGLTADYVSYQRVNDRVYWSNGTQNGVIVDGVNRSWGMPIPNLPTVSAISGNLTAGTYQYSMTTLRDGMESGAALAGTIELTVGQGLRFTFTGNVSLYVTEPNGTTLFQCATSNTGTYDHIGGALSLPLDTQWCDQPPAGQCLTQYRGRIYIASGQFIYATTALGYELCDLRDYLSVDNSKITMLAGLENGLLVGTEKATYYLSGMSLAEFTTLPKGAAVIPRTLLIEDGQTVTGKAEYAGRQVALFTTTEGICLASPDGSVVNLTQDRYGFSAAGIGAAGLRNDATLTQYLLFLQT
jgi:hypothetical protein